VSFTWKSERLQIFRSIKCFLNSWEMWTLCSASSILALCNLQWCFFSFLFPKVFYNLLKIFISLSFMLYRKYHLFTSLSLYKDVMLFTTWISSEQVYLASIFPEWIEFPILLWKFYVLVNHLCHFLPTWVLLSFYLFLSSVIHISSTFQVYERQI
jgi:hypothetical protein